MKPQELKARLRGVLAFTPTPFTADDKPDLDGLARHVDYLCRNGVQIVVVCGGAGEFYSLDLDEYRDCIRTAVAAVNHRVPVIAGIGHSTRIACQLAEYAASVGADGLMIAPLYFVTPTEEGLLRHYRSLAQAAGLGMIVYHAKDAVYTPALLARLAEVDEVVALKDEYGDLKIFTEAVERLGDRMAWIDGMAEMLSLPYCAAGAQAMTSGIVNFAPQLSLKVWELAQAGRGEEWRQLVAQKVRPLARLRERKGYGVSVVKAAMNLMDMPGGTVRAPLLPLTAEERSELRQVLVNCEVGLL